MSLIIDGFHIKGTERIKENLVFFPGDKNTSTKKPGSWNGLGIHWTGGEGNSDRVIKTLKSRGLSVQFIVDKDGTIVQCADLRTKCAHIGSPGNDRFVGVETVCRGFATKEDLAKAKAEDPTLRDRDELDWSEQRDVYRDTIGGKAVNMASFGPAQVDALIYLSNLLWQTECFSPHIPARKVTAKDLDNMQGPVDLTKYVVYYDGSMWLPAFDRKPSKYLSRASKFHGVLGHFHIHKTKYDPGTEIFYALWADGWNPTGKRIQGV